MFFKVLFFWIFQIRHFEEEGLDPNRELTSTERVKVRKSQIQPMEIKSTSDKGKRDDKSSNSACSNDKQRTISYTNANIQWRHSKLLRVS
ncbi:Protein CBG26551 [Caenorhabditis briggsae]|uniref:Protein CBG26551 n=1 Tax=Caenorhabditis briggsae TaxID=6238 RepID=B6IK50_CAEBR|nr:Protein CBG26551 [Caenorhabditis briggsae]CAS00280.1 Protein CBG26551 [Caenorhabditis briggsae]